MNEELIEFSAKAETEEERTISGLAVPYGVTTRDGRKHQFAQGSIDPSDLEDLHLHFNHDPNAVIGSVFSAEETEAGLRIKARISTSARGEEIYTLIREGHLNKFSVGVVGRESRQDDDVTVWTKADLHEVSVVPRPAFRTAAIERVYSAQADSTNEKETDDNTMSETINPEVVELKEQFSDLERKVALFGTQTATPAVSKYGSAGEALKAIANGDSAAKQVFAYTGATSADADVTRPAFVNNLLTVVEENREILNAFKRSPLPATGNSVEYPRVSGTTGTVGPQGAEGTDLPYMEVQIDTATAPVITYGGYSSISRQAIERSDVSYLDAVLRFQAQQYAKATNSAVRTAVAGAAGTSTVTALSADSGQAWVRLALAARRSIKAANSQAGLVIVSGDIYDRLFSLVDSTGRPVFNINGDGANTFGDANLVAAGSLAGLPVVIDDAAANNTAWFVGADAVTVFEQPGAPVRLQDENIINLTKDFSLYGYMAVAVTNPAAIVRADVDLTA